MTAYSLSPNDARLIGQHLVGGASDDVVRAFRALEDGDPRYLNVLLHRSGETLPRYPLPSDGRKRDSAASATHCPTCICGRRAPVQGERTLPRGPGSITWEEHLLAWSGYAARYGTGQSAERIAERAGFGYDELTEFLGHEPTTWRPR